MKRLNIFVLCLILVFLPSCSQKSASKSQQLKLATSFYPIYVMTINITDGVEGVTVQNVASNTTGCIHDFTLKTEDVKKIESSDAFIINGAYMETFLEDLASQNENLKIIDSSKGIELITQDIHDTEEENLDEHHHGFDVNSHIWVSISNYIEQVKNISKEIISLDPKNSEVYEQNTKNYIEKLTNLKNKMHTELNDVPNRNVITFHESFDYFAKEFGLNIYATILNDSNNQPSAKDIAKVVSLINESGINILFTEPQYSSETANTIINETGAKIYSLDPAVTGSNDKNSYLEKMEQNLKVLKEALYS